MSPILSEKPKMLIKGIGIVHSIALIDQKMTGTQNQ